MKLCTQCKLFRYEFPLIGERPLCEHEDNLNPPNSVDGGRSCKNNNKYFRENICKGDYYIPRIFTHDWNKNIINNISKELIKLIQLIWR